MRAILNNVILFLCVTLILPQIACAAKHDGRPISSAKLFEKKLPNKETLADIQAGIADFESRASLYSEDEWNFVLGYAHFRRGNWKEAEGYLNGLEQALPLLSDHIIFYRAVIANKLGRASDALLLLDDLKKLHPTSAWAEESVIERARGLIAVGRYAEARKYLRDYAGSVDGERSFDANILIAKSFVDEGNKNEAVNFLKNLAISSESDEKLSELSSLIDEAKRKFHEDINEWLSESYQQLRLAESYVNRSQWDEAARRLERISGELEGELLLQVKWLLAKCYRSIHRYDDAIKLMELLSQGAGAGALGNELLSTLATTYTKKNEYAKAVALRERMMDAAPAGSAMAAKMASKIAFLYMDEGKYDDAIPMWRRSIGMGASSRQMAKWYLAWCYYLKGDTAESAAILDEMLKEGRRSPMHDRLLYWKGRVLQDGGGDGAARVFYEKVIDEHPGSYYAELAARRLNKDMRTEEDFPFVAKGYKRPISSEKSGAIGREFSNEHAARAALFDKLGLHEEAARELRMCGVGGCGMSRNDFYLLAARNFAHDLAYAVAEGGFGKIMKVSNPKFSGIANDVWTAAYPMAYAPVVERGRGDGEIDPLLVWSIMRNESAFRPEVVSPAGAVGLMQLMPTTASRLSHEMGGGLVDRRELYVPASNISFGVLYLKKLAGLFPRNPVAWIASYNAGEEAVGRWIKNGKTDDIEKWIEEIPYDETNLYVKKVLTSYWKYQRLYQ